MAENGRPLHDLFIVPEFDRGAIEVSFTAPFGISGGRWEVLEGGNAVVGGKVARSAAGKMVRFGSSVPDFKPWTLYDPFLYVLRLELDTENGDVVWDETFGMRKFHVEGAQIFMNNEPLYIRGHIRGREAHDHPDLAGLGEEEYYEKNILAAKEYGFNFCRFHSKVPPEAYFRAADRLGFLTHIEVRKYYGKYQAERELMDHQPHLVEEETWRNTILRLRNHPSLMVYCLGNEIDEPGRNPEVEHLAKVTRELDPTRLFIDTCARGEFDRCNVDFDVQHMGYFCPFGRNHRMFDITDNWTIFGSVRGLEMVSGDDTARTRRKLHVERPVLAHEICHYVGLRDLDALEEKFERYGAEKPWWISELKKLVRAKGLEKDYPSMLAASRHYQYIWWKQALESVRRSPILAGFHFLQLADTDRYENANGILDCFDDPKGWRPEDFLKFNSDTVVLADLPRRTFFEGERLAVPVWISHFSPVLRGEGVLEWSLARSDGDVLAAGKMDAIALSRTGRRPVAEIEVKLPEAEKALELRLECRLLSNGKEAARNDWPLWLFPNRPGEVSPEGLVLRLRKVDLFRRYPQLAETARRDAAGMLMVAERFDEDVLGHLERGGDVLMLYRVDETRDRSAPMEKYYLPATWDRFKGVIWDRGHNLGGFIRRHPAVEEFPCGEFLDFQFYWLVDDCDKVCLDGFPVDVDPIIQGVDKANRDRYDVFTFGLRELQPDWTMRKFAYLFELKVGKGRLLVSGFNFTGIERGEPAVCGMFEGLLSYARSERFEPRTEMSVETLRGFLLEKGAAPRVKERMMTQYWQFDAEPLESATYWKEAEEWIRKG